MRWSPVVNPPCLYILLRGAVICPSLSVGHRGVGPQRPVPTDRPALKTTSASPGPEAGTPTQRCGLARCASEFRSVRPFTHRPQVSGDMKQNGLLRVDIQSCTFPLAIWGPGCGLVTLRCSGAWGGIPGVLWRKDTSLIRQREEAASARNRGVGGGVRGSEGSASPQTLPCGSLQRLSSLVPIRQSRPRSAGLARPWRRPVRSLATLQAGI